VFNVGWAKLYEYNLGMIYTPYTTGEGGPYSYSVFVYIDNYRFSRTYMLNFHIETQCSRIFGGAPHLGG